MYKLAYTERFKKAFNDLTNNEQIQFQNKMKLFVENVLHPSLRTKKIKGQKDLYESSINMDISDNFILSQAEESEFELSISWPLDSQNDERDSEWGNLAYQFELEEAKKHQEDSTYQIRPSIKIIILFISFMLVSEYISDLKFTNDTGSPIYIKTYSDSESVTVEIYGKPNEEGYTYDTRSETIEIIAHTGDVIKPDEGKVLIDDIDINESMDELKELAKV